MVFTSYEDLKAAVAQRRAEILTLEVDLGSDYSPEYEAAKVALAQAKLMEQAGMGFMGATPVADLEARVAELAPEPNTIFIQYSKLDLGEWTALTKMAAGTTATDQYEKVLVQTFRGLYGSDPVKPDDWPADEEWVAPEPLTLDAASVSTRGDQGVLPAGAVNGVVQSFITWQNSGGDVTIRPTKSGRD